jgi:hypothetical protein
LGSSSTIRAGFVGLPAAGARRAITKTSSMVWDSTSAVLIYSRATVSRGAETARLIFEPHAGRGYRTTTMTSPETAVGLRDSLGHPPRQVFCLTYDAGAAFHAGNAGLMARLPTK